MLSNKILLCVLSLVVAMILPGHPAMQYALGTPSTSELPSVLGLEHGIDGTLISQLMQMDAPPVPAPHAGSKKDSPVIDVTPVISWVPDGKLKGVLVCVHGLGLHKGTYAPFGERMAKAGYAVYAMDVRGFGEFQKLPGDRKCDFTKALEDVREALNMVHASHKGVPIFLMGESMGGAIAMRVTEENPELMDGLISSVPGAKRKHAGGMTMKVGMKLLTGGGNAQVNVAESVVNGSTKKPELRKAWSEDELARFTLTASELMQFQHFMDENERFAGKITKTPVLMVQGAQDELVKQSDNQAILDKVSVDDKTLVFVMNAEHLIFEEGQFDENDIAIIVHWMDSPSPKKASLSVK